MADWLFRNHPWINALFLYFSPPLFLNFWIDALYEDSEFFCASFFSTSDFTGASIITLKAALFKGLGSNEKTYEDIFGNNLVPNHEWTRHIADAFGGNISVLDYTSENFAFYFERLASDITLLFDGSHYDLLLASHDATEDTAKLAEENELDDDWVLCETEDKAEDVAEVEASSSYFARSLSYFGYSQLQLSSTTYVPK